MTRVARTKLGLLLLLLAVSIGAVLVNVLSGFNPFVLLAVFVVLLVPGRVQSRYFRELLQGRRLLDAGRPAEALEHLERFMHLLRTEPWRKRLFWLSFSVYTPSAEAMTLNNIGVAHLGLGNLAEAEGAFRTALTFDPLYPLPHYNSAVLAMIRGDEAEAARSSSEAVRLGYSAGAMDAVIRRAQSLLARIEGRGASKA